MPIRALIPATLMLAGAAASGTEFLQLERCRLPALPGIPSLAAECGRLTVPQDPARPDGASIELFIARVPALSAEPQADPITLLAGGPGQAASEFYAANGAAFQRLKRDRDIILVDQRGTGQSQRLSCSAVDDTNIELADRETTVELTRQCLNELPLDPANFTTSVAVRDLDQVREALGIAVWNVYGISYGTRVAQHYMRRYPEQTRSVILDGVVPPEVALGPDIAIHAQATLNTVFKRCQDDDACQGRFGDVEAKFDALLEQLAEQPVELTLWDPLTGAPRPESFGDLLLKAAVRLLSYTPDTAALLPLLIHEAYSGDWQPLAAQAFMVVEQLQSALAYGMHNSVVCSEDVPFYDEFDREAIADTYLGTQQVDTLIEVCGVWPKGPVDEDFKSNVRSETPTLLLSGALDPITPPEYAERVTERLPNSRHFVIEGQGHGMAGVGCVPQLMSDFLDGLAPDALDAECLQREGATPFFLSRQGPAP